jgi:tetratricopeptide (TPR) repeat protein
MTTVGTKRIGGAALVVWAWCTIGGSTAYAQDTLAKAKTVYASAAYEDALTILDALHTNVTPNDAEEVAAYQLFCLMALGRTDEARRAIENIVHMDPLYHPSEAQASPRVLSFFEDVRKPLLPQIVRETYAKAKADYDKKDYPTAVTEFDSVIAIIGDMGPSAANLADLGTLATGFRDLSKAANAPPSAPPAPPPPAPAPATPASGPSTAPVSATIDTTVPETGSAPKPSAANAAARLDPNKIYGSLDTDVKAPTALSQGMPAWTPANAYEKKTTFAGVLELIVDEQGRVTTSSMRTSAVPSYDNVLIHAATAWRFKPATLNGTPVKYRLHMRIQVGR